MLEDKAFAYKKTTRKHAIKGQYGSGFNSTEEFMVVKLSDAKEAELEAYRKGVEDMRKAADKIIENLKSSLNGRSRS